MIEAAVVGAGPAGLIAAREIAEKGFRVKVFEEHPGIGAPNHCAGILSVEGLERLSIKPRTEFINHEVRGGTVYSPDGTGIRITGNRTRAYIVDREAFDRHLADMAHDAGAEIETGHRVSDLLVKRGTVTGVIGASETKANIVIDAEGAGGALARRMGLPRQVEGVLAGINVDVSGLDLEPSMVEVWFSEKIAQGLFAWVVPTGEGGARCGLATSGGDALEALKSFLGVRLGPVELGEPVRWPVLTGGPVDKTHTDGMLLVGDVAGQVKPTTGGGVILGGLCAMETARTAAESLEEEDYSTGFLRRYDERWRGALGKEFSSMLGLRRFVNGIPDDRMDRVFASLKGAGLEPTLESFVEEGDMDMQSAVIRKALTHPGLLRVMAGSLGRLALGELRELLPF